MNENTCTVLRRLVFIGLQRPSAHNNNDNYSTGANTAAAAAAAQYGDKPSVRLRLIAQLFTQANVLSSTTLLRYKNKQRQTLRDQIAKRYVLNH